MFERLNQIKDMRFDVLGDVLSTLRTRGSIFFRSEIAAPWGLSVERVGLPRFHIALSGDFYVGTGRDVLKVRQGEIVMLPSGQSHWIADAPGRELIPSDKFGQMCELSNSPFRHGRMTNLLMCGKVEFDNHAPHPILDALPDVLCFPRCSSNVSIWQTVNLIEATVSRSPDLRNYIVDRLAEILFAQLLHDYADTNSEAVGFLAAIRDPRLLHALTLIHRAPNFNWSVSSLGGEVGMSRATITRRFQESIGVAPMTYVNNWRISKSLSLVKYTSMSLDQVAKTVGFASARTLSIAFRRRYHRSPNELRQSQRDH